MSIYFLSGYSPFYPVSTVVYDLMSRPTPLLSPTGGHHFREHLFLCATSTFSSLLHHFSQHRIKLLFSHLKNKTKTSFTFSPSRHCIANTSNFLLDYDIWEELCILRIWICCSCLTFSIAPTALEHIV